MEDRLQKFAKLVDAGSFTRGAAAMHLSQPALTAAVKKLERELHAELLQRGPHRLHLTPAGELAYAAGKNLTTHGDNLRQQLAELSTRKVPFSLGMIDSVAAMLFVQHHELDELEQWAQVSLSINNSGLLTQAVMQHTLDAAIVVGEPAMSRLLDTTPLGAEPLILVAHADIAKAANRATSTGFLPNFLSYNQGSTTQQIVQAAARSKAITLAANFYSTSPEIMLQLVSAGRGTAALPYLMVKKSLSSGVLIPVFLGDSCVVERPIAAVRLAVRQLPEAFAKTLAATKGGLQQLSQEAAHL